MNPGSDAGLREELERLKRISGMGTGLKLVWAPDPGGALSGEVKGSTIFVYESDEEEAAETLRHEFLDHCVSQAIDPYRRVTNSLIKLLNVNAYKRKEQIVEALSRLMFKGNIID
jgi:hypothetical protein